MYKSQFLNMNCIRRFFLLVQFIILSTIVYSQGYNHTWLIGYVEGQNKARLNFDLNSYQFITEQRNIGFSSTQGNISDINGNFLMSSNGIWISNMTGDTMHNGYGLNPNSYTSNWPYGLTLPNGNLFLPWPDDTTKYVLFHQTGNYDPNYNYASRALYYSIIDMTGDSGKGEVIQKNTVIIQDTLGWGLAACKHANGRDWWIVALRDSGNILHTVLLTPTGVQYNNSQAFQFPQYLGMATHPTFSPDGSKFAFTHGKGVNGYWYHDVRLLTFDRCIGVFSNPSHIDITDGIVGLGLAFSPNSQYLYVSKSHKIIQFNTDTINIAASIDTVAVNDGFYSPQPPFQTDFGLMYLAANGKIYLSSGNSVQHLHEINYPDSAGTACDVQQHAIYLNGVWHSRSVPNHPNYYLGCDTTLGCPCLVSPVGINEVSHDFRFNIYPNPSSGNFNIIYLLPQNKEGKLEVFDITGRIVFSYKLPPWSTLQQFNLPQLSQGIYAVKISSDGYNVTKKIIITE
jgi:hypothetical protein